MSWISTPTTTRSAATATIPSIAVRLRGAAARLVSQRARRIEIMERSSAIRCRPA
jgi:hypothetical protein